jgi:hypothetical protein
MATKSALMVGTMAELGDHNSVHTSISMDQKRSGMIPTWKSAMENSLALE